MNKKKRIFGIVIIIIVVIGVFYLIKKNTAPTLKSFAVANSNFVVETNNMQRIAVYGLIEGSTEPRAIGAMEIVEQNKENDQTWILAIPAEKQSFTEIYAEGTTKENKITKKAFLTIHGPEAITAVLWPQKSQAVLYGTVNSVIKDIVSLNIQASTTIKVTLAPTILVTDKTGKKITASRLAKGTLVAVIGDFTDETSITAYQIEEQNTQRSN